MASTSSSPKPKRRSLARRWFQDLKSELKGKLNKSSTAPSRPSRASNSHASGGSRPTSRPASRRSSPTSSRSENSPKQTAWGRLKTTLNVLQGGIELVPPLESAIGGLISLLDAAAKNRRDYEKLAVDLEITVEFLHQHLKTPTMGPAMDRILSIARTIEKEIESVKARQERSAAGRALEADGDKDDLIGRYRRIEQLLHRIQIEASMSTWAIANEHLVDTRLEKLGQSKLASYDSKLSTSINRRTCTENTRTVILSDLNGWSDNPKSEKVYWMDGMAGTGKTTIACTLSGQLESRGQLAASFFCTRTSPECRDPMRIVPTIAYQLARHSTPFRSALCRVLSEDPDIGSRNIFAQFERLLKEPLEAVEGKLANNLVVVIDALDECEDTRAVSQILDVLFRYVGNLPIKFFVTSRPEAAIREKMLSAEGASRSIFHLHDIERSFVREDIELYLREELEFMSPSPSDVKKLAALADNLFIYAATAIRYILPENKSVDPRKRLANILAAGSMPQKIFSHIDRLYSTVLSTALDDEELELEDKEAIQLVLWTAVCAREPISLQTLTALSGVANEGRTLVALQPLRSVLHVSEQTGLISTLHASFSDYMFTPDRSKRFYCDESAHGQLIARRCLEVMEEQLRFNICDLPSSFASDADVPYLKARIEKNISPSLFYACQYWPDHLKNAAPSDELCGVVDEFFSQRLLFWMEVLNLKECMTIGVQGLVKVQAWLAAAERSSSSTKFCSDAYKFVARFAAHAISLSTPHIYISALPLCPPSSTVSLHYRERMQGLMEVKGTAITQLGRAPLATWTSKTLINSVEYSPDGAQVVCGGFEHPICIRNVHSGKVMVDSFKGHTLPVSSVKFSPNGACIASGSDDQTIRVWDARDGTPFIGPLKGHSWKVTSVAFSPDGTRIVSGSCDYTVRVWDWRNGTHAVAPFEGHTDCVNSVTYSPDGTRIASGSDDRTIRLWDVNTATHIASFKGHVLGVLSVDFSPDNEHIVSGSRDFTIRVWSALDGTLSLGPLEQHTSFVSSVAYSPNGAFIASGSYDRTVRVWHACNGTLTAGPFEGHTAEINSVAFSPDGTRVVSGSNDQSVRIWNVLDGPLATSPSKGHSSRVTSADFSPDGALIASASDDGTIRVWSALDAMLFAGPFKGHTGSVLSVKFSPDGTRIVSGSDDYTIRVWHTHNGVLVVSPFEGHKGWVTSVAFSPNGSRIASGSYDQTIRVWDASNGTLVAGPFEGHTHWIKSIAFSPDGAYIASGSTDKTIRIWNSNTGTQIATPSQEHWVTSVCFSPDSSHIISGSFGKEICIWNARDGKLVGSPLEAHMSTVNSVAFSSDGALIVSGSNDRTIGIWSFVDGKLVKPLLQGHTSSVNAAQLSPDGLSIVSASADHTLRVWDVRAGHETDITLTEPWDIRDDGWVLNAKSHLLFWLPGEIRYYFPRINNRFTIGPLGSIQVDFDSLLLGQDWNKCLLDG
ncbi:Vegetative incompatibility protein HET-E-1 [Ceratobasidium theobromae]|uniref:Vegetative incompatibility protein HET-E-1 n=1 Tax=Ceratobasidium theobromae TaxID=1582974 RepID=A0A5N5QM87_9AGAM|nr:Vegetative incompatibility protein HET-E-1 [Ceratobasidium theobromae]